MRFCTGDSGPHHDSHSRQRRASSCKNERRKFFVETWIVVDAVFHARLKRLGLKSRTAVSQYILTLINLVSGILFVDRLFDQFVRSYSRRTFYMQMRP